ncbi:hypothetical protein [Polyangium jinanense]|uniref:Uncharacterized protein n=1 Tax=Polyangium jinanense TaxID=2829994 RepID=A0A9X4ARL9_9BACT|nr:hypothetical protein [Polyangium jinanense]MDC3982219.1 hypothetical protein [Polyangium jinanense]
MNARLEDWFRECRLGPVGIGSAVSEALEVIGQPRARCSDLFYPGLTLLVAADRDTLAGFRLALREEEPLIPFVDLERWRAISKEEAERSFGLELTDVSSYDNSTTWGRSEATSVGVVKQQILFDENGHAAEVEVVAPDFLDLSDDAFHEHARKRLPEFLKAALLEEWVRERKLGPIALGAPSLEASTLFGSAEQGRPSLHYPGLLVKLTADRARVRGFSVALREDRQLVLFADLEKWRSMSIEDAQRSFGLIRKDWPTPHGISTLELETPSEVGFVRLVLFFSWYRRRSRLESIHVSVKERRVPPGMAAPPISSPPERMNTYLPRVYEPPQSPTGERLLDWLLEGRLGPLPVGSRLDDVIKFFGEPWSRSSPGIDPPILKYPALEVFASSDHAHLAGFHIEPGDVEEAVPYDDLELWQCMSVEDAEKLIGQGWERSVLEHGGKESIILSRWLPSPLGRMRRSIHFEDDIVTAVGLLAGQSGPSTNDEDNSP